MLCLILSVLCGMLVNLCESRGATGLARLAGAAKDKRHRDVVTTQGVVRGYRVPLGESPHYAFRYLGIPYAGPPLKQDRFKVPLPPRKWDGIFEASHRVRCPQPGDRTARPVDENCLVVNVFAPEGAHAAPVLVHVHDGDFVTGWGDEVAAPRLLRQNIVMVTFNYRLGALGFLCLGVREAKGNVGLKDQIAALYWIHRNIGNFGGNPNEITVYGTGTGAVSIQLLLLSKSTIGLVHRAILESGSAISEHALSNDPVETAKQAGNLLKLPKGSKKMADTISMILQKYKSASAADLVKLCESSNTTNESFRFVPCIENSIYFSPSVLDKDPWMTLQHGDYHHVPMLVTYTNLEGIVDAAETRGDMKPDIRNYLPKNLKFPDDTMQNKLVEQINDFYFRDSNINDPLLEPFINYFGDIVVYPIIKSALLHASKGLQKVYLMEFSYEGGRSAAKELEDIRGAKRGDILSYIQAVEDLQGEDEVAASRLTALLSNFVKFGDPTPLTTPLVPIVWDPISPELDDIYSIKALIFGNSLTMRKPASIYRIMLWDKIYSSFYKTRALPTEDEEY